MADARVNQLLPELLGKVTGADVRCDQLIPELLGKATADVYCDQLVVEILGAHDIPPTAGARVNQLVVELMGGSLFPTPFTQVPMPSPVYPVTKDYPTGGSGNLGGYP